MFKIIATFVGFFIILFGIILMTKRKIILELSYIHLFSILFILSSSIIDFITTNYIIPIIFIVIIPLSLLGIIIGKYNYFIFNINNQFLSSVITNILKQKNILYSKNENSIFLNDYNKSIEYNQSLNSVYINLKNIKNLFFYEEFILELKNKIKQTDIDIFPSSGFYFVGLGIIAIFVVQYILV